jgi:hypothetical protein
VRPPWCTAAPRPGAVSFGDRTLPAGDLYISLQRGASRKGSSALRTGRSRSSDFRLLRLTRITRKPASRRERTGLRAAVVEPGGLADDDGPGARDGDALQVGPPGHLPLQSSYVRVRQLVRARPWRAGAVVPIRLVREVGPVGKTCTAGLPLDPASRRENDRPKPSMKMLCRLASFRQLSLGSFTVRVGAGLPAYQTPSAL